MQLRRGVGSRWMSTARAAHWQVKGSLRLPQAEMRQHSSPAAALQLYISKIQAGLRLAIRHRSGGPACGVRGRPCRQL